MALILGVLSDTHGRVERARAALRLLDRLGAECFVHCGDVGSDAVLDELFARQCRFVWGNSDEDESGLHAYAKALGIAPPAAPLWIEHAGWRIAVYHGHELAFARLARAASDLNVDAFERAADGANIVLFGHTHVPADQRLGRSRLVNPGALHRARVYTVATIDLQLGSVEHWRVDDNADASAPPKRVYLGG